MKEAVIHHLKPRIIIHAVKKNVIDGCYSRIKKISKDISTVHLPKKRSVYKVRKNFHGEGYAVYKTYESYVYKGYIVVANTHHMSKVLEILSNSEVMVSARIT